MQTSRRGFRISQSNPVETETIEYPDEPNTSTIENRKRKAQQDLETDEAHPAEKEVAKKHTQKKSLPRKSKYPRTALKMDEINSNQSHSEILNDLIRTICAEELTAIDRLFEDESVKSINGSQSIHRLLHVALEQIPTAVRNECTADQEFLPEYSAIEKRKLNALENQKRRLQEMSDKLDGFEQDVNSFGSQYGLWLGNIPSTGQENVSMSTNVNATVNDYGNLLTNMEEHCDRILQETDQSKAAVLDAQRIQQSVYDKFNQVRQEVLAHKDIPTDTKELIRSMIRMY